MINFLYVSWVVRFAYMEGEVSPLYIKSEAFNGHLGKYNAHILVGARIFCTSKNITHPSLPTFSVRP